LSFTTNKQSPLISFKKYQTVNCLKNNFLALSTIVSFTTPSINVLSKLDLLNKEEKSFVKNFLEDEELQNNLINSIDDGQVKKLNFFEFYKILAFFKINL